MLTRHCWQVRGLLGQRQATGMLDSGVQSDRRWRQAGVIEQIRPLHFAQGAVVLGAGVHPSICAAESDMHTDIHTNYLH